MRYPRYLVQQRFRRESGTVGVVDYYGCLACCGPGGVSGFAARLAERGVWDGDAYYPASAVINVRIYKLDEKCECGGK